jgi:hypothetical protein
VGGTFFACLFTERTMTLAIGALADEQPRPSNNFSSRARPSCRARSSGTDSAGNVSAGAVARIGKVAAACNHSPD